MSLSETMSSPVIVTDTAPDRPLDELVGFIHRHPRLLVLTGAGCSTASGIPDYRDRDGNRKNPDPVQYRDFVDKPEVRQRYWARSLIGWPKMAAVQPNAAHTALMALEQAGFIHQLVTQNVDSLHQKAGSRRVIDLHGRLDSVDCLSCGHRQPRDRFQHTLIDLNPDFAVLTAREAPDGDARLENTDFSRFRVPPCPRCGGVVKPHVVFFGESIPRPRTERALAKLAEADGLLVVGSSLMVYSGFRFCRLAAERNQPIAAINLGRTRADDLIGLKVAGNCAEVLPALIERLVPEAQRS